MSTHRLTIISINQSGEQGQNKYDRRTGESRLPQKAGRPESWLAVRNRPRIERLFHVIEAMRVYIRRAAQSPCFSRRTGEASQERTIHGTHLTSCGVVVAVHRCCWLRERKAKDQADLFRLQQSRRKTARRTSFGENLD
jgi:hypothetical protein